MYENGGNLSAADVAAVTGGNRGFGGFGGYGDGGFFWILILFLFAMMGGWGNGWGNNAGGGAVPYVQAGFDQQAVMSGINGLQTTVANGFANAEVNECNRAMNMQNALNNGFNQLALAGVTGFNGVNSGLADLKYTVATENCSDRQVVSDGLRDIIANNTANTNAISMAINNGIQSIKDDLCADRIAAKDAQIQALQNQLNMATLAASQTAQTAQLQQYGNQLAQNVTQTCCPKPVPAYVVANPNGCGCNGGYLG